MSTLTLKPYQVEGAAHLASRQRTGLYDEPGLGKTAQAIRAREDAGHVSTLVICPAGVRPVWPWEIRLWGRTAPSVLTARTIYDATAWARGRRDVLVVSFEQAVQWQEVLASEFFDCLIVDEAHYLKNPEARRTRAVLGAECDGLSGIAGKAVSTWLLTGTPIKNDPSDMWTLLRATNATKLTYTGFQRRYFDQRTTSFSVRNSVKKGAAGELRAMLDASGVMRTFEDVGEQLPPARLDLWPVDGDNRAVVEYLKQYPGLSERLLSALEATGRIAFEDGEHVSRLRALLAEAKAPNYARAVLEELRGGSVDKLVIMGHHRKALVLITEHLAEHGVHVGRIDGTTSNTERERLVRSFQDDPNGVRVLVGNIQAAGTGITLTAACRLDMFESSWTPTDNVQAVKRVHRTGQRRGVLVRFVMLQNSFDETVAKIVTAKANAVLAITGKNTLREAMVG